MRETPGYISRKNASQFDGLDLEDLQYFNADHFAEVNVLRRVLDFLCALNQRLAFLVNCSV